MAASPTTHGVAAPGTPYAGIVSRAVALIIDACVLWLVALAVAGLLAVIGSLVGGLKLGPVAAILSGLIAVGANLAYFSLSWTLAGRTFGQRLMRLRVVNRVGGHPRLGRSVLRALVMNACVTFGGVAFVTVLLDARRRGPHDMVAGTTVRYDTASDDVGLLRRAIRSSPAGTTGDLNRPGFAGAAPALTKSNSG